MVNKKSFLKASTHRLLGECKLKPITGPAFRSVNIRMPVLRCSDHRSFFRASSLSGNGCAALHKVNTETMMLSNNILFLNNRMQRWESVFMFSENLKVKVYYFVSSI